MGREELVDSVIVDANIYNPSGTHLGALPGTLLSASHKQDEQETHKVELRRWKWFYKGK